MKFYIRNVTLVLAVAAATPALAGAKIDFAAYEGPPKIVQGEGGTKITKNGIDYWTTGTPPRRYQLIGFVQDKRDEDWDGGQAVGSPGVARKVKKAGGDAVIIESQEEAGKGGGAGYGTGLFGILAMGGSKTITRMLVIRYMPDTIPLATTPQTEQEK